MQIARPFLVAFAIVGVFPAIAQQTPTDAQIIAAAVLPLPESYRADATVVRFQPDLKMTTLRKGSNGMICSMELGRPETFAAACYQESVFAINRRQLELIRGLHGPGPENLKTANEALEKEVKAGKLNTPQPSVGFRMRGPMTGFDWAQNKPSADIHQWKMIIIPHATGASLALPDTKQESTPWVMDGGMLLAHIMVEQ